MVSLVDYYDSKILRTTMLITKTTQRFASADNSFVFILMSPKPQKPNEIPVPAEDPETIPTPEPEPNVWPRKEPETQPEPEPLTQPPPKPPEIPEPPKSRSALAIVAKTEVACASGVVAESATPRESY